MNAMNRHLVLALILAASMSSGRAADLVVGDALTVAEGRVVAKPQAALGAGSYLVVWRQGWPGLGGTADIRGRRLEAGTLRSLDPQPIPICSSAEVQDEPRVAYQDGLFLVVWQDFRNSKDFDIRGALVEASTGRPKHENLVIAGGDGNQVCPAVTTTDDGFLVVWQDWRGDGRYGISSRRVSINGDLLGTAPQSIADLGARPAAARSGDQVLVCWVTGHPRGVTSAALLSPKDATVVKSLGTILPCCHDEPVVAADGKGNFMVAGSRTPYPDPWGWGGPGAVVCARVTSEGTSPERELQYGSRHTLLSERKVPNVVDAASWGKQPNSKWDAGAVGGFPGTPDGLWPRGWPAVAFAGEGTYLFAWGKGKIAGDRLTLEQYEVWLRGMDEKSLVVRVPDRKIASKDRVDETHPALVTGPRGEVLLLYEEIAPDQPRRIIALRLQRD
jgi:hypothetical protein